MGDALLAVWMRPCLFDVTLPKWRLSGSAESVAVTTGSLSKLACDLEILYDCLRYVQLEIFGGCMGMRLSDIQLHSW